MLTNSFRIRAPLTYKDFLKSFKALLLPDDKPRKTSDKTESVKLSVVFLLKQVHYWGRS